MTEAALDSRWRALAEKAAGRPLDLLGHETDDGLTIEPLYPRSSDDGHQPWRGTEAWLVSQLVDHPDPVVSNASALLDLEGGADALALVFAGSPFARGFGLAPARGDIGIALDTVELDLISIRLDAGGDTIAAATALADIATDRRLTSAGLDIDLGYDPIGLSARTGEAQAIDLRFAIEIAKRAGLTGRALLADGRPYHEAGAGEAQELAAVLATVVGYLRHLEACGLDLASARDATAVLLPFDADVFLGIAKARAARRLWARLESACNLDPQPLRLHAETSWRMMTRYDPWVNAMRATAATAAAGLGGADTITVLPMTLALGLPDDGARRVARNVGRVLIDEAHLAKVDDPAGGSGGLDALTNDLCERAWTLFQEIEAQGGIEASLRRGSLRAEIAATARVRATEFATLGRGMVGTSRFPSLAGSNIRVLDVPRRPTPEISTSALPSTRDAEPFEALRDRAEARAALGKRPSVYLATLGAPAAFGPRAIAAVNFLAAAGISINEPMESLEPAALASRFAAGGTSVACLCGTDVAYADEAESLVAALRLAGAKLILMVGFDDTWRKKGVDLLIHDGANALQTLAVTLETLIGRPG